MVGMLGVGRLLGGTILGSAFSPAVLFASGEQGAWYDPSDFSTMFQNSTGTTPVTAAEQPVGLLLDKSKELVLGSELITNGTFDTNTTGWTVGSTSTFSVIDGQIKAVATSADGAYFGQLVPVVAGKSYKVGFTTISDGTSKIARLWVGLFWSGTPITPSSFGSHTVIWKATTTGDVAFWPYGNVGGVGTYILCDNISVRELSGNHASQSTAGSQPVLKATSNVDFDGTDDKLTGNVAGGGTTGFLFVAGINIDVAGSNQTIWSDTGTNTGYRVRINSSNQVELAAGNGSSFTTAVTTETLSAGTNYVVAAWHDGANLNVKLGSDGAVASQAFATASAGTTSFTVGMDNGAVSSQLNGKVFNAVCVKDFAGSVAAVNSTIAYVNGKLA